MIYIKQLQENSLILEFLTDMYRQKSSQFLPIYILYVCLYYVLQAQEGKNGLYIE